MAPLGRGVARECHLQNPASPLFSEVSSSGGGLPGRLDLERDLRRSLFWRFPVLRSRPFRAIPLVRSPPRNYTPRRFAAATRPYQSPESFTVRFWLRKST